MRGKHELAGSLIGEPQRNESIRVELYESDLCLALESGWIGVVRSQGHLCLPLLAFVFLGILRCPFHLPQGLSGSSLYMSSVYEKDNGVDCSSLTSVRLAPQHLGTVDKHGSS